MMLDKKKLSQLKMPNKMGKAPVSILEVDIEAAPSKDKEAMEEGAPGEGMGMSNGDLIQMVLDRGLYRDVLQAYEQMGPEAKEKMAGDSEPLDMEESAEPEDEEMLADRKADLSKLRGRLS